MASEDTDWLKNNFGSEPDVAFPGYYGVEELPGLMKIEMINLKTWKFWISSEILL